LFVNSAILIVAGASLSSNSAAADASLFGIYDLLTSSIGQGAGTIFALALLLSGISAGIVCTIAGQMVSEGALNWTISPWLRRLVTRSISITPSIIIAGAVGKDGLTAALNGSQVALSVALPFISAPLIYFTCRNKFMTVKADTTLPQHFAQNDDENDAIDGAEADAAKVEGATTRDTTKNTMSNDARTTEAEAGLPTEHEDVKMRNHWVTTTFAVLLWLVIAVMNVANLVLLGLAK
jgi:metal iron transporter